ncbi:lipid A biosynthesis acyltransferase [Halarcobacter ebronensis]|uniref:Lipid A biosynthesis acyltransferase n=1 Tax=Halarcobacter ebronensis TaxID=1462615 RepID=A0A4Q1ANY9_9BACT|nr:lipid A biosynthesis acyltransferase [Halarcobacter ebronensis]QKF83505.1 lysophospholipid acyltransferase [Halarcobacter ebronensis]RXK08299.1 lipid A biosynthesis acyltransferase [Halarcobacter ebronensis]
MHTKQRGSGWSIKLVYNLYRLFGYKFIYYLMYPVTFFYFIFAGNVKNALRIYYANLSLPFNNWIYFNHLRMFAICMVDRFISKVSPNSYTFIIEKRDELEKSLRSGLIMLLSHYGGWATSSNSAKVANKLNIVMKEVLLKEIKSIEESISNEVENINIIDLNEGGLSSSIQIANALLNEEVVAMMADRANDKKHTKSMEFFKKSASFNKNPFQIAYKMAKPIILFFVINEGLQKYRVEYLKLELDKTLKEEEAITKAMEEYVQVFERILKKNPNQWFNFYNFWRE